MSLNHRIIIRLCFQQYVLFDIISSLAHFFDGVFKSVLCINVNGNLRKLLSWKTIYSVKVADMVNALIYSSVPSVRVMPLVVFSNV
jgi:hypothetical protein